MTAKITIVADNQTAPAFASLIRDLASTDSEAAELTETAGRLRGELNSHVPAEYAAELAEMRSQSRQLTETITSLGEQQQLHTELLQQNVAAVKANRDGFMEWTNTLADFSRNLRAAYGEVTDFVNRGIDYAEMQTGVNATTFALTTLAARALRVGGVLLGVKATTMAVGAAFDATGKKVVTTEAIATPAARRMAESINAGLLTVEEAIQRTGKSLDELGLKVETNADRMGAAFGRFGSTAVGHLSNFAGALADQTGIPAALDKLGQEFDDFFSQATRTTEANLNALTDAMNELSGIDAQHARAQEAFFAREEAVAGIRAEYRKLGEELKKQAQIRRDLAEIARITTEETIDTELQAIRTRRSEILRTGQAEEGEMERLHRRQIALSNRAVEIELRNDARRRQSVAESAKMWNEQEEERRLAINRRVRESVAAHNREYEERQRLQEEFEQFRLDVETDAAIHRTRMIRESVDDERLKTDLTIKEIRLRANAEIRAAKDVAAQRQIAFRAERQIRETNFQHEMAVHRRAHAETLKRRQAEIAAAREQFQTEVDLLKQKLQAEEQLQGGGGSGQTEFQKLVGQIDQKAVLERIVQQRLKQNPTVNVEGRDRRLSERDVRRQVLQQARQGQLAQREIQNAQAELAKHAAVQGAKSGKFSKATAKALFDTAQAVEEANAETAHNTQQIEQINEHIKAMTEATRRRRAQRRGARR